MHVVSKGEGVKTRRINVTLRESALEQRSLNLNEWGFLSLACKGQGVCSLHGGQACPSPLLASCLGTEVTPQLLCGVNVLPCWQISWQEGWPIPDPWEMENTHFHEIKYNIP
ncbi:hypothetical protein XENTR_v10013849 [Xenopus tropicalis]|nr:hypothetical protein XENTR_v10013849 [Xenopus tropicalis]